MTPGEAYARAHRAAAKVTDPHADAERELVEAIAELRRTLAHLTPPAAPPPAATPGARLSEGA